MTKGNQDGEEVMLAKGTDIVLVRGISCHLEE